MSVAVVSLESQRGPRTSMEDMCVHKQCPATKFWWQAVYDGHGGSACARHLAASLHVAIFEQLKMVAPRLRICAEIIVPMIKKTYITWAETNKAAVGSSGSTATAVLISPDGRDAFVANLGDSRVMIWRNNTKIFETIDHTPMLESETKRITDVGGWVLGGRVSGTLAVSRAFGDYDLKEGNNPDKWFISIEPEVTHLKLTPGFLYHILAASDGLWTSKHTDAKRIAEIVASIPAKDVCSKLVMYALEELRVHDNVTALLVQVRPTPMELPLPDENTLLATDIPLPAKSSQGRLTVMELPA